MHHDDEDRNRFVTSRSRAGMNRSQSGIKKWRAEDRTPFTTWGGYGGLAVRGPGDWHDTLIRLADGSIQERVLGEASEWCDLAGTVGADGAEAPAGLSFFNAPTNPRHPLPWYGSSRAATYGDEGWSNFALL